MTERERIESEMRRIAAEIKALPPPERLRLAAGLLEAQRAELAYQVIDGVRLELGAALAMAKTRGSAT